MVPAYTLPPNAEHVTILRALCKETLGQSLVEALAADIEQARRDARAEGRRSTRRPQAREDRHRLLSLRANVSDGWHLGGAALSFVLRHRALQRFVLAAIGVVLVLSAAGAVTAVLLRREAGPVGYVLVGLAAYYCLSVLVTAVAVGVAGLVADILEARPVTPATGLAGDRAPPAVDRRLGTDRSRGGRAEQGRRQLDRGSADRRC